MLRNLPGLSLIHSNSNARNGCLFALQLRKVRVERRNEFWRKAVDRGIFISWLISKNIRVISWDVQAGTAELIYCERVACPYSAVNEVPVNENEEDEELERHSGSITIIKKGGNKGRKRQREVERRHVKRQRFHGLHWLQQSRGGGELVGHV